MARIKNTMKVVNDTRGKIDKNYAMFASNIVHINNASANVYEVINNAFCFGYAQGQKAEKAKRI